uniref:PLA2c domain-containing protein n=1 Tax=Zooxanthella nutricula TaxID=1333877 RepID=A0A7S2QB59_9DINO
MSSRDGAGMQQRQADFVSGSALAVAGGGLRASSVATGLTSGLMVVAHDMRPGTESTPTLQGTGIYDNFASIASVSGGSWFAAELIYSTRFVQLVEEMAGSPAEAAQLHRQGWTMPWLSIARKNSPYVKLFARLAKQRGFVGVSQDIRLAGYFWKTGMTWTNWTLAMLQATAGIDMSTSLGSEVTPWAEGKAWLVCHVLTTPSVQDMRVVHIAEQRKPTRSITQFVANFPGQSIFTPAVYSYILGSGDAPAPIPYVAASALPPTSRLNYQGAVQTSSRACCGGAQERFTSEAHAGRFESIERGAHALPVVSCAAASSAAAGDVVLLAKPSLALDAVGADFAVWQGAGSASDCFERAARRVRDANAPDGVTQTALDGLADDRVQAVIDAGFSDPTGIAYAVRAGAREVVVYLNNEASNVPIDLTFLFVGGSEYAYAGGVHAKASPVFGQSANDMLAAYASFPQLKLCEGSTFVTAISVGTLQVSTVDSGLWGIPGGVEVTLHIVGVASTVTIGYVEDVYNYDILTQEVIQTVSSRSNSELVRGTVMPWFLGSADCGARPRSDQSTDEPSTTPAAESGTDDGSDV